MLMVLVKKSLFWKIVFIAYVISWIVVFLSITWSFLSPENFSKRFESFGVVDLRVDDSLFLYSLSGFTFGFFISSMIVYIVQCVIFIYLPYRFYFKKRMN